MAWSDEFDGEAGSSVNSANWNFDIGNRDSGGWGNQELQYYTDSTENVRLDGEGNLEIVARRDNTAGECWNGGNCEFTSGRLTTKGKQYFDYGKVEARVQVPAGLGLWPAVWSLGDGAWPDTGEIDIMEFVGKEPTKAYGTVHGPGYSGANGITSEFDLGRPVSDDFHTFTIVKNPGEIIWYIDGQEYHRVTPADLPAGEQWVFDKELHLLVNLAVGGLWPGSPDASTEFPATMKVDYVRIYEQAATTQALDTGLDTGLAAAR